MGSIFSNWGFSIWDYFHRRNKKIDREKIGLQNLFFWLVFKCSGMFKFMSPSPSVMRLFVLRLFLFIPVRIVSTLLFNFICLLLFKNCLSMLIIMFNKISTYVRIGCQVLHEGIPSFVSIVVLHTQTHKSVKIIHILVLENL